MSTPPPPSFILPPESPRQDRVAAAAAWATMHDPSPDDEEMVETQDVPPEVEEEAIPGRISMYVKLFDEMITTVLDSEAYLFTPSELWILRYIASLPYEPHYLLTRLLLRRAGKVHALESLRAAYSAEIGVDGVKRAAELLAQPLDMPSEVLDADPQAASPTPTPTPSPPRPPPRTPMSAGGSSFKGRAKPWANVNTGLSKTDEKDDPELAEAIRVSLWQEQNPDWADDVWEISSDDEPTTQPANGSGSGPAASRSGSEGSAGVHSLLPRHFHPITSLAYGSDQLGLDDIMSCVPAEDLKRVARAQKIPLSTLSSREATMKALRDTARRQTTLSFAPLDRKGKGKGKPRSFSTCTPLERLIIQELLPKLGGFGIKLDDDLYRLMARINIIFSRTPPATASQPALLLPPILVASQKRHYPDYGSPQRSVIWTDRDQILIWERAASWETIVSDTPWENWSQQRSAPGGWSSRNIQPMSRTDWAKTVRGIWETVWPIWNGMVAATASDEGVGSANDRFRTEHVLTRVIHKSAEALGVLHEYDLECQVLRALLAQRRWRRGRRGAWYDRLALILMTHYKGTQEQRIAKFEEATQICIDGLLDNDTHMIYRPGLSRRLTRLENKLNLSADERHICYAGLNECETRELVAVRSAQNLGQTRQTQDSDAKSRERGASLGLGNGGNGGTSAVHQVGKSVWVGRDGEVTVEGWVLEWWEDNGYEGFHSESSILTTLFALLMWPVLFHPMPGAFETKYQTAPLDLGEDSFARSRRDLIDERIAAMESTEAALEMLRETDERERPRGTWAVGLSWDFGARELREILTCLGGKAMATICLMLSEDYRHRGSGVPDLIVWDYDKREARFVEVKGPGDTLSETQKIWIDVLLSAGVPVEVCKVKDRDEGKPPKQLQKQQKPQLRNGKSRPAARLMKRQPSSAEGPIVLDDSDDDDDDDKENEDDEFMYESGDEGKPSGRWAKAGGDRKRTKR